MFSTLLTRECGNQTPAGNVDAGNWARTVVKGGQYRPVVAGATVSFTERLALKASTITRAALMAAVTAVAAQITVPLFPVPFTLQVLTVILSGLLLGVRHGALAQAVYVLVGAIGVPVFAGFTGGLGHVLGPTGGYLISYPIAAAVAGFAAKSVAGDSRSRALWFGFFWGCAGLAVIYAFGATWLAVISGLTPTEAIATGILPFVIFDLIKVGLAALVAVAAAPAIALSRT
jgi:biotin transport system substrate-specific component